jgi:hypothetical protein
VVRRAFISPLLDVTQRITHENKRNQSVGKMLVLFRPRFPVTEQWKVLRCSVVQFETESSERSCFRTLVFSPQSISSLRERGINNLSKSGTFSEMQNLESDGSWAIKYLTGTGSCYACLPIFLNNSRNILGLFQPGTCTCSSHSARCLVNDVLFGEQLLGELLEGI